MRLPIRSEEHTSELQSHDNLVCRLLLEKKQSSHLVRLAGGVSPPSFPPAHPPRAAGRGASPVGHPAARMAGGRGPAPPRFFFNDTAPPDEPGPTLPLNHPI